MVEKESGTNTVSENRIEAAASGGSQKIKYFIPETENSHRPIEAVLVLSETEIELPPKIVLARLCQAAKHQEIISRDRTSDQKIIEQLAVLGADRKKAEIMLDCLGPDFNFSICAVFIGRPLIAIVERLENPAPADEPPPFKIFLTY